MTDKDILIASAHVYGAAFAAAWATGSGASKEDLYTRGVRDEKAATERAARIATFASADFFRWATAQAKKTTEPDPRPITAGDVVKIVEPWTTGRSTGSAPCRCLRRVESTK